MGNRGLLVEARHIFGQLGNCFQISEYFLNRFVRADRLHRNLVEVSTAASVIKLEIEKRAKSALKVEALPLLCLNV